MTKPLVTFALFAYNQERYIREALAGALAQTYSPLQIVLSDDNSTDRTFEIMREVASQYHGPHQILLNRNESNQGIGMHVNKVMSLAEGEFIVVAAGDDISLPERTTVLVEKWIELGRGALSIHTSLWQIDEAGHDLGIRRPVPKKSFFVSDGIIGASHGWSKKLFDRFGDLVPGLYIEDQAVGFRALLLDGLFFIDLPLVKYRVGGISLPSFDRASSFRRWLEWGVLTEQHLLDIKKLANPDPSLLQKLEDRVNDYKILQELSHSPRPFQTLWLHRKSATPFLLNHALKYIAPRLSQAIRAIHHRELIKGLEKNSSKANN